MFELVDEKGTIGDQHSKNSVWARRAVKSVRLHVLPGEDGRTSSVGTSTLYKVVISLLENMA